MFLCETRFDSMVTTIWSEQKSAWWFDYFGDPYYPNWRMLSREMVLA